MVVLFTPKNNRNSLFDVTVSLFCMCVCSPPVWNNMLKIEQFFGDYFFPKKKKRNEKKKNRTSFRCQSNNPKDNKIYILNFRMYHLTSCAPAYFASIFFGKKKIGERSIHPIRKAEIDVNVDSKFCNLNVWNEWHWTMQSNWPKSICFMGRRIAVWWQLKWVLNSIELNGSSVHILQYTYYIWMKSGSGLGSGIMYKMGQMCNTTFFELVHSTRYTVHEWKSISIAIATFSIAFFYFEFECIYVVWFDVIKPLKIASVVTFSVLPMVFIKCTHTYVRSQSMR